MSQAKTLPPHLRSPLAQSVSAMPAGKTTTPKGNAGAVSDAAMVIMPITRDQRRSQVLSVAGMAVGCMVLVLFLYTSREAARRFELLTAVRLGNASQVRAMLKAGAGPQAPGIDGKTPLEVAASYGRGDIVRMLLARKVDPQPALEEAALRGRVGILNLLIARGADVTGPEGGLVLCSAAQSGDKATVNLLLRHGADVNTPNPTEERMRPLMYAARSTRSGVVHDLIARGAKVNARSTGGQTALMFAAAWNEPAACKYLLQADAEINAQDIRGQTPLMLGVLGGNVRSIKYLLAAGASLNLKDNQGKTALDHAVETNHLRIANLLRRAGAK